MTAGIVPAARRIAEAEHLLIALDFDGTLSPLVDEPMTARALPRASSALAALAEIPETTVALVSGRSLVDLRIIAEHTDTSPLALVGSHGAEVWLPASLRSDEPAVEETHDEEAVRQEHETVSRLAREALPAHPGVLFEPKRHGFGVHVRLASVEDGRRAVEAVDELMARRAPHWRRRTGHNVVEYAYRHEGKDTAIAFLRELTRADAVLFAGDDVTDEDAIRALGPDDLGIRVGEGESAAALRVADPQELSELLWGIANIRARRGQ